MVIECLESNKGMLMEYLEKEAIYNTFMIADIENYGFDNPCQDVYAQLDGAGQCVGAYVRYYHNLIVAGSPQTLDTGDVYKLLEKGNINTVMGKSELVKKVYATQSVKELYSNQRFGDKNLYGLYQKDKLLPSCPKGKVATLEDVDAIYGFLMEIPSFRPLYAEKSMIINRLETKDGLHLFIEQDGEIIAHANSAARTKKANMIGGVAVKEKERGKGCGKQIVSDLCRIILEDGRTPCLFSDYPEDTSLFNQIGFEKIGNWGVLELSV